jgi:hypothetical protein
MVEVGFSCTSLVGGEEHQQGRERSEFDADRDTMSIDNLNNPVDLSLSAGKTDLVKKHYCRL